MVDARKPAAAGVFYPADRDVLATTLRDLLAGAKASGATAGARAGAHAIVVPHRILGTGGMIAAAGWARVAARTLPVKQIVLLGPSHHVPFAGIAAPFADSFATPLGVVPVDRLAIEALRRFPQVSVTDLPHEQEPSLEVQVPFIQVVAESATIVPLLVGEVSDPEAAEVIESLWDDSTLVVVSTDLSRYFDAATARTHDEATACAIESLQGAALGEQQACAHAALRAVLMLAQSRKLRVTRLALGHSGESSGEQDEVVGLGAFMLG
jgi:AmmeMemoRadiSam system protein B